MLTLWASSGWEEPCEAPAGFQTLVGCTHEHLETLRSCQQHMTAMLAGQTFCSEPGCADHDCTVKVLSFVRLPVVTHSEILDAERDSTTLSSTSTSGSTDRVPTSS